MKINEIKEKYKDEVVLLEVIKVDYNGEPLEGKVLVHSRNRDDTYHAMKKISGRISLISIPERFLTMGMRWFMTFPLKVMWMGYWV